MHNLVLLVVRDHKVDMSLLVISLQNVVDNVFAAFGYFVDELVLIVKLRHRRKYFKRE